MDLELSPCLLRGSVMVPPGKSQTIRLLFCAALAAGESSLAPFSHSEDVDAALSCLEALGACWQEPEPGLIRVRGRGGEKAARQPCYDCGESATVLRLMLPLSLALTGGGIFRGRGRLLERPLQPYRDLCERLGISWEMSGGELRVGGWLQPGAFSLPGNVSSQFFSGLLLALPLLDGPSELTAMSPVESADYIGLTLQALRSAGVLIRDDGNTYHIEPQSYQPFSAGIEGDWSQGAFWLAAETIGNDVTVLGLSPDSLQADRRVKACLAALKQPGTRELDLSQCPDLLPPLAAAAALRPGSCRFIGAGRLRLKESDRLHTVTEALRALGAEVKEYSDSLEITGRESLCGGVSVDCRGDHRIAMMCAVAATRCRGGRVKLLGADCVRKSYPDFWERYQELGGDCHVLSMGE